MFKLVCAECKGETMTCNRDAIEKIGIRRDNGDFVGFCPQCAAAIIGDMFKAEEKLRKKRGSKKRKAS